MSDKESRDLARSARNVSRSRQDPPPNIDDLPVKKAEENETFHPVYRKISLINGQLNRMGLNQLKVKCKELNLDCNGRKETVKRRLKEYYKVINLKEAGLLDDVNNNVDFFVVIDFEATCEEKNPPGYPHEIIEFPAVLVDSISRKIVDQFHAFVRPTINPVLSDFCTALTGIDQDRVDKSDTFCGVYKHFVAWLESHRLGTDKSFTIVTDGPFDMGRFLYLQTQQSGLQYPTFAATWTNIRKCFANFYKRGGNSNRPLPLPDIQMMLQYLGLEFEGQPHSGIDDARNIARILICLLTDRAIIRVNERIRLADEGDHRMRDGKHNRLTSVVPIASSQAKLLLKAQKKKAADWQKKDETKEE